MTRQIIFIFMMHSLMKSGLRENPCIITGWTVARSRQY